MEKALQKIVGGQNPNEATIPAFMKTIQDVEDGTAQLKEFAAAVFGEPAGATRSRKRKEPSA